MCPVTIHTSVGYHHAQPWTRMSRITGIGLVRVISPKLEMAWISITTGTCSYLPFAKIHSQPNSAEISQSFSCIVLLQVHHGKFWRKITNLHNNHASSVIFFFSPVVTKSLPLPWPRRLLTSLSKPNQQLGLLPYHGSRSELLWALGGGSSNYRDTAKGFSWAADQEDTDGKARLQK